MPLHESTESPCRRARVRNVIGRPEPIAVGSLAECLRSSAAPLSVQVHRLDALRYSIGNLIPWVHKELACFALADSVDPRERDRLVG